MTGFILAGTGSFTLLFVAAGSAYIVALLIIHLLVPRLEPARIEAEQASTA